VEENHHKQVNSLPSKGGEGDKNHFIKQNIIPYLSRNGKKIGEDHFQAL